MAEFSEHAPGTPCWVDVQVDDVGRAVAFYGQLFGWEAADQGEEAGHYHLMSLNGKLVAGAGPKPMPQAPSAWQTSVATADVDATAQRVKDAGGSTFMEPFDVMSAGRMGVFADPAGAPFIAWQPRDHHGAQLANEPGALGWSELHTRDVEAAKAFYGAVFGWTAAPFGEGTDYTIFTNGDKAIGGVLHMGADFPPEVPSHWLTYFEVADADAAVAEVESLGGRVVVPAQDMPDVGRFAVVADDQGAVFAIIKTSPPPAPTG